MKPIEFPDREKTLIARMAPETYRMLAELAQAADISMAACVRAIIRDEYRRQAAHGYPAPAEPTPALGDPSV